MLFIPYASSLSLKYFNKQFNVNNDQLNETLRPQTLNSRLINICYEWENRITPFWAGKVLSQLSEYQIVISIREHVDSCFIKQELIWKKTFCTFNGDLGHK